MNERVTGTVKWFSRTKGYGFLTQDGDEADVFVHYSSIEGEGFRNLERGQAVEFVVENGPKGLHAKMVTAIRKPKGASTAQQNMDE